MMNVTSFFHAIPEIVSFLWYKKGSLWFFLIPYRLLLTIINPGKNSIDYLETFANAYLVSRLLHSYREEHTKKKEKEWVEEKIYGMGCMLDS